MSLRLGRESGDLFRPAPPIPGAVVTVGCDLDVPGAQHFRRLQQAVPDGIGFRVLLTAVPPVRDSLEFKMDDSVVGEHGSDPGQPVLRNGGSEIVGQQPEAPVPRRGRGFDPLAKRQWTA